MTRALKRKFAFLLPYLVDCNDDGLLYAPDERYRITLEVDSGGEHKVTDIDVENLEIEVAAGDNNSLSIDLTARTIDKINVYKAIDWKSRREKKVR